MEPMHPSVLTSGHLLRKVQTTQKSTSTPITTRYFNEKLAIPKQWQLNQFPDRTDIDKTPLNLIPENALNCLALRFGNSQLQLDSLRARWKADRSEINITNGQNAETLIFRAPIGEKLQVAKQFTFNPDSYFVDMTLTFQNVSDEPLLMGGTDPQTDTNFSGDAVLMPICSHMKRRRQTGATRQ